MEPFSFLLNSPYDWGYKQNVEVMTYSRASKVILDDTNTARGIEVERFGQSLQYFASNEVILSGGAIGSPQVSD